MKGNSVDSNNEAPSFRDNLAGTELQSQGDAFGWVSEGCLRHMGARFSNEKTLGCQWSRLQFEFAIVGDVAIMENIKINQKISG